MSLSRRDFVRLAGLVSAAAGACSPLYRRVAGVPAPVGQPAGSDGRAYRVLGRAAFGPSSVEWARVAEIGLGGWVEEQLATDPPQDDPTKIMLSALDVLELDAAAMDGWEKETVLEQLRAGTLLRQLYSRRQLYERMVEFWTDHFNIYVEKGDCWQLKVVDDREVIRQHALGKFEELLLASAHSPAMLIYLDNQSNEAPAPNENYAREVMELHTLGVDGGYSQQDVMELARCLTGWTVKESFWRGQFVFKPELHDKGGKVVLGERIKPAGKQEAVRVLQHLSKHESTTQFLAHKLVRRFVSDRPEQDAPELVESVAETFHRSDGDLRAVARTLFLDGLVMRSGPLPLKFKRPVDLVTSSLRALHAASDGGAGLQSQLAAMGHLPFDWPTPDGPPDKTANWSAALLPRWQFSLALARGEIEGTQLPLDDLRAAAGAKPSELLDSFSQRLLGRPAEAELAQAVAAALTEGGRAAEAEMPALIAAGLMAAPEFQWR